MVAKAKTLEQEFEAAPDGEQSPLERARLIDEAEQRAVEAEGRAEAAEARIQELMKADLPDEQREPTPENMQRFLDAPMGLKMDRVRRAERAARVSWWCTRVNYQEILDEDADIDQDLVRHMIQVDTAEFVRMNESDDYLRVTQKGELIPTRIGVTMEQPEYRFFDQWDLGQVCAMRDIDPSNLSRDELIARLQATDDEHATINQMLAQ